MEKKIIACGLMMLLLVSCFVACGKKPTIKGKNGMEYVVVTDEEGSTILNDNGDIVVYVTDDRGRYVKGEDGERETAGVTFPAVIANGRTLETPYYRITFPEGWSVNELFKATMDGNDKAYIKINSLGELLEGKTFDGYVSEQKASTQTLVDGIKKEYPKSEFNISAGQITAQKIDCYVFDFKLVNNDDTVGYYAQIIYFMFNDRLYKVEYICNEGGYNSEVDALSIISSNLVMKDVSE